MKKLFLGLALLNSIYALAQQSSGSVHCIGRMKSLEKDLKIAIRECDMGFDAYDAKRTGSLQICVAAGIIDFTPGGHHLIVFREMPSENHHRIIKADLYKNTGEPFETIKIESDENGDFYELRSRFQFSDGSIAACASIRH